MSFIQIQQPKGGFDPNEWEDIELFNQDDWEDIPFPEPEKPKTDWWKSLKAGILEGVPSLDLIKPLQDITDKPENDFLGNIPLGGFGPRIRDVAELAKYPAGALSELYNKTVKPLTSLPNMGLMALGITQPETIPITSAVFGAQQAVEMPRQVRDVMQSAQEKGAFNPETIGKVGELGLNVAMTGGMLHGGGQFKKNQAFPQPRDVMKFESNELPSPENLRITTPYEPLPNGMIPLPEGWSREVGKTTTKGDHTYRGEVDWNNKKIVFADEDAMSSPIVHNHETAHVIYETMPEVSRDKLMGSYLQQKQNTGDYAKYGVDWMVENNHHREDIAIDLGNYFSNPERVEPDIRKLFDLWFKNKVVENGKVVETPRVVTGEVLPPEPTLAEQELKLREAINNSQKIREDFARINRWQLEHGVPGGIPRPKTEQPTIMDLINEEGASLPLNEPDAVIKAINEHRAKNGEPPLSAEEEAQFREAGGVPLHEPITPIVDEAYADKMINDEMDYINMDRKPTETVSADPESLAWQEIYQVAQKYGIDPNTIKTMEDVERLVKLRNMFEDPNLTSNAATSDWYGIPRKDISSISGKPYGWEDLVKIYSPYLEVKNHQQLYEMVNGGWTAMGNDYDLPQSAFNQWLNEARARENKVSTTTSTPISTPISTPAQLPNPSSTIQSFGKVGIEVGRDPQQLIKTVATSYSGADVHVATKEMLQNHLDAAADMGSEGKVHVNVGDDNVITVSDNGAGLPLNLIQNEYTKVTESGKRGRGDTAGEMGVGKVTYMTRGDRYDVTTVVREPETNPVRDAEGHIVGQEPNPLAGKLMQYEFGGTPDDFFAGNIEVLGREVPEGTPTGTSAKFTVNPSIDVRPAVDYLKQFSINSRPKADVTIETPVPTWVKEDPTYANNPYWNKRGEYHAYRSTSAVGDLIDRGETEGMRYSLYKDPSSQIAETNEVRVAINSRGMFQGSIYVGLPDKGKIPQKFILEVDPKVIPGHKKYPLTTPTRESLTYEAKETIKNIIIDKVLQGAADERKMELSRIFQEMGKPHPGNRLVIVDAEAKLTPEELSFFGNSYALKQVMDVTLPILDKLYSEFLHLTQGEIYSHGFIIDSKRRGVNVQNPGNKRQFAILLNPITILESASTPREAANAFIHVLAHEFTHTIVREEGPKFTAALADVYTKFDLQEQFHARNAIEKSIIGPDGKYNPEVLQLLQQGQEALGRTGTPRNAVLTEGASELPRGTGPEGISGSSSGGRISPIEKLKQAIADSYEYNSEQRDIYRQERAVKFAKARQAKGEGEQWFANVKNKMRGEHTKVEGDALMLEQADVDSLFNIIKEGTTSITEQLHAGTGLSKILKGEVPQFNELQTLEKFFGKAITDFFAGYHGMAGPENLPKVDTKRASVLSEVVNLPRSLQASIDLSAPFRQGIGLIHTKAWWTSWDDMIKAFGSEKAYRGIIDDIMSRPNFQKNMGPTGRLEKSLAQRAGLKLTDLTDVRKREESMQSTWAEKVPGVRMSNRAYTAFLDKLRADTFDSLIKDAERAGLDPRHNEVLLKQIAAYINNASGRGSLGNFERTAVGLNSMFFSPRLIASRLQMMNPKNYFMTNKFVRKQYVKSLVGLSTAWFTVASLAKLAGAEVSSDPTNSDFGKIRIGNVRIDPAGGFQQYLVLMARLMSNEFTSATTGKSYTMGQKYGAKTREQAIYDFFKNKLAPIPHTALNFAGSTRYQSFSTGEELMRMFIPMFFQDVSEILQEDPSLLPAAALGSVGFGVQEFGKEGREHRFLGDLFPKENDIVFPSNYRR